MLDSVFDDKAEAIAEAKNLMARTRALAAVRVVAVAEDESGFREWTVYKQTMVDDDNEQANQRAIQSRREVQSARAKREAKVPGKTVAAARSGASWIYYIGLMARVVLLVGAGAFAILYIHRQFL